MNIDKMNIKKTFLLALVLPALLGFFSTSSALTLSFNLINKSNTTYMGLWPGAPTNVQPGGTYPFNVNLASPQPDVDYGYTIEFVDSSDPNTQFLIDLNVKNNKLDDPPYCVKCTIQSGSGSASDPFQVTVP